MNEAALAPPAASRASGSGRRRDRRLVGVGQWEATLAMAAILLIAVHLLDTTSCNRNRGPLPETISSAA
jgi:hypothetical protein